MRLIIKVFVIYILITGAVCDALEVGKVCPVSNQKQTQLGLLILSEFWFHSGRSNASYIPRDDATGIGVEIHFFNNQAGQLNTLNKANCDKYRVIQVRKTNSLLNIGEEPVQVDIPAFFESPFYDNAPLEFGYHSHLTPLDSSDKPWDKQSSRASTLAIYDTPYVSDGYGIDGEHIRVEFETCIVCQREIGFDELLSCATWGYQRDYLNKETGWTEPEIIAPECQRSASEQFIETLAESVIIDYQYWLDWR
ncbi:hypothetical protein CW745_02020 [Psychromonas sp. psych-6C06]|uniref:hypothetical protein n=1 Tax=Psychromonas sp. psych-6C06 TaxID=2058089 RepID=UPI000C334B56|nr:hypothetical protein [Psychromonas sp. psych-6C06]PKF63644.1 hypothetical protein CW745_02020 [Psychromonas sp. psych-6C06]